MKIEKSRRVVESRPACLDLEDEGDLQYRRKYFRMSLFSPEQTPASCWLFHSSLTDLSLSYLAVRMILFSDFSKHAGTLSFQRTAFIAKFKI